MSFAARIGAGFGARATVSLTVLTLGRRVLAFVLLGVAGVVACARPAQGAGCHVPDRPVVGFRMDRGSPFARSLDTTSSNVGRSEPPVLGRRPCSETTPGSVSERVTPSHPAAVARVLRVVLDVNSALAVAAALGPPRPLSARLDRPPR